MPRRDAWWIAAAVMLWLAPPEPAHAMPPTTTLSVSVFYGDLSPWGHWVDLTPYGWCWSPDVVAADWRPYTDGMWVYTDLGWTWETSEPWGWAVYHYGRWVLDPVYGWVWVPGTEWGPAWVAWREDPDWVGWAPLPPSAGWSAWFVSVGSDDPRIDHRAWSFVRARELTDPRLRERILPATRNTPLLARTRDATRYERRDGRPFDRGIEPGTFARRTGLRVTPVPIRDAGSPRQTGRGPGRTLAFYRPSLRHAASGDVPRAIASHRADRLVAASGAAHPERPESRFERPEARVEPPARFVHPETRPQSTPREERPQTQGPRHGAEAGRAAPAPEPRRETIHPGPPPERAPSSHVAHRSTESPGSTAAPRAIGTRGEALDRPGGSAAPRGHERQRHGGQGTSEDAITHNGNHGREATPEAGR